MDVSDRTGMLLAPPPQMEPPHASTSDAMQRRLPIGAEAMSERGVHVRVWAPERIEVAVVCEHSHSDQEASASETPLTAEGNGYFSGLVTSACAGTRYRLRLDDDPQLYPDPASRFQPDGPHGASQVIDPSASTWSDSEWCGIELRGQVLYEMHVGTFTREGTWEAAARELPALVATGITAIELMPIADFAGEFGWGYDGVDLYAPTRLYGTPEDFRRFVDRAHALGIGVLLDVVYNHLGPDGCYLRAYSRDYFTERYDNEWGDALNFDGERSAPVREFFITNARYWVEEFHLDGLRIDATQQMFDCSPEHIVKAITRAVREAAGDRRTLIVCENEPQHVRLVRPAERGGHGMDALWNDDFHHSAIVAVTGRNEGYYSDYRGRPQELLSTAKWGYLYQGQRYQWQKKRRGTPIYGVRPEVFVNYIQNHDQIANSANGARLHQLTSPGQYRAITAFQLLIPGTPLLFQGQEYAASQPFLFFADHKPELAGAVRKGRAEFLKQFPSIASSGMAGALADPCARETFERCKLDHAEREQHAEAYALHLDLLRMRRDDGVFSAQGRVDGAVLGPEAFVLRFFGAERGDRLLLVNLGRDLTLHVAPEPLLAPPEASTWNVIWSSEDRRYGGLGTPPLEDDAGWHLPAHAAVVLAPVAADAERAQASYDP